MNAAFAITYHAQSFAAGTTIDHVRVTIVGQNNPQQSQSVPPGTTAVDFTVAADSYTYTIDTIDGNGQLLTSLGGSFVASAPQTVSLQVPSSASVTVS